MIRKINLRGIIPVMLAFFLLFYVSCSSDLVKSSVENFLEEVKSGDISKASEYLFHDRNSYDFINSIFTFENDQQRELAFKTFSKINYRVKSVSRVDENMYKARIEIEHVDFTRITEEILPEIVDKTDASAPQSEDEYYKMIELVNDTLIKKLSEKTIPMLTSKFEIEIFKDDALTKVSIIPNEELLNALSGNLVSAYDLMGEEEIVDDGL